MGDEKDYTIDEQMTMKELGKGEMMRSLSSFRGFLSRNKDDLKVFPYANVKFYFQDAERKINVYLNKLETIVRTEETFQKFHHTK